MYFSTQGYVAPNVAPAFAATVTVIDVDENDTVVYTPQATDSDALTYTLGGPDADKFVINGDGSVSFVTAPDFEAPGSAAGTNSYSFSVTASDGTLSDVQAVTVNVADVAEITYDNVTLDFDAVGDVNSDWAFGGASASQTTYDSVGVLSFTHPVGAESWAGATIAKGYGDRTMFHCRPWFGDGACLVGYDRYGQAGDGGHIEYSSKCWCDPFYRGHTECDWWPVERSNV